MITLTRVNIIRETAPLVAEELQSVQTQINQAALSPKTQTTVGAAGSASALPATPEGYVSFTLRGVEYVMPFYAKS